MTDRTVLKNYRWRLIPGLFCIILPVTVLLGLWLPEYKHYHISDIAVDPKLAEILRSTPADSILDELTKASYWIDLEGEELIKEAESILTGRFSRRGEDPVNIALPFGPKNLTSGTPKQMLAMASLYPVEILLDAYAESGRDDFFDTAKDMLVAFADYDRGALFPKGYLRNDHATAARVGVLIKFWKIYRRHNYRDSDTAHKIIKLAARTGRFLAKPSHFMFASNHGIMQNLALLQLCMAFPNLPGTDRYEQLAVERLNDQIGFYINSEGAVLEHSAGYQVLGLHLLAKIFRFLAILNIQIPQEWQPKYEKGIEFVACLRRPDGSLPLIGDTKTRTSRRLPVITGKGSCGRYGQFYSKSDWRPVNDFSLYPVAGYSIWWDGIENWPDEGNLAQTVIAWSYFKGQAHKLSDEMSILLWADGRDWWTNIGYWPYATKGRNLAESWSGSNAPHLVSENVPDQITGSYFSDRETGLPAYGHNEYLSAVDLLRTGPGTVEIRRQVIKIKNKLWIIVDYTRANEDEHVATVWTADHKLQATEGLTPRSFVLNTMDEDSQKYLVAWFLSSNKSKITRFRGNRDPYLGWQAVDFKAVPTTSIYLEQPADNSWAVTIWSLRDSNENAAYNTESPAVEQWNGPKQWTISIPDISDRIKIKREADKIIVDDPESRGEIELLLEKAPSVSGERAAIRAAYDKSADKYPFFHSAIAVRTKITKLLLLVFVFQEIFFFAYRRYKKRFYISLRALNCLCWIIGGVWLLTLYRIY
jgi:hypothetical protein